jgi:hypothetical protein
MLLACRGDGHGRHDGVELARAQGRDHAVELVVHPGALDFELGADGVAQFDIEALQAAIGGDGFEGRVFGEYAEADFFPVLAWAAVAHRNSSSEAFSQW